GEHQQGEVPGDDLADDAHGLEAAELLARKSITGEVAEELGPAGVVVEVAGDERDVDVAGLADGLAVVHGLEHGETAGPLLHLAREGVEIACALVTGERLPAGKGSASGFDGEVDVCGVTLRDLGEDFAGRGILRLEGGRDLGPGAIDEVAKAARVGGEPLVYFAGVFGSWTVFHRLKLLKDAGCHFIASFLFDYRSTLGTPPPVFVQSLQNRWVRGGLFGKVSRFSRLQVKSCIQGS